MKTIQQQIVYIHFTVWIFLLMLFIWIFWSEGQLHYMQKAAIVMGSSLVVFYFNYIFLKNFLLRGKILFYLCGLFLIILLGPLPFLQLYTDENYQWKFLSSDYFAFGGFVFFFLLLSGLATIGEHWFMKTLKKANFEKQVITTELQYLKTQINPHFLFNTLNNIHTLSYMQSPSTPDAIMRLSSLMRYMLYESNAPLVSFKKEMQYLNDYIELQQLRYSETSIVELDVSGQIENLRIAPLLFIHIIENAYKHSPGKLKTRDIKVGITYEHNTLSLKVVNPLKNGGKSPLTASGGIGLQNLKKRLELIYPKRYQLNFTSTATHYEVLLNIECLN